MMLVGLTFTNRRESKTRGFSLAELMIALAAGLIVLTAVVAFLMASFKSNAEYVQSTHLTQALRNTLDLVVRDLRRAGYDDRAVKYLATGGSSPFSTVLVQNAGAANGCVVYAYDSPTNPGIVDPASGEVRGLRRIVDTTTGNGAIEYAISSGTASPNFTCTDAQADYSNTLAACVGKWCGLTDPRVTNITAFTITDSSSTVGVAPNQVRLRDLGIAIKGQLPGSTEFTRGVQSSVRIRTDCFKTSLADCNVSP